MPTSPLRQKAGIPNGYRSKGSGIASAPLDEWKRSVIAIKNVRIEMIVSIPKASEELSDTLVLPCHYIFVEHVDGVPWSLGVERGQMSNRVHV